MGVEQEKLKREQDAPDAVVPVRMEQAEHSSGRWSGQAEWTRA